MKISGQRETQESSLQPPGSSLLPKPGCSQVSAPGCAVGAWSTARCRQLPRALPPLQVQKEFPTTNRTHLRDACAASSYALTLLLQGYKFNHTTWLNIRFVRQVGKCPAAPSFYTLCCQMARAHPAPAPALPGWGPGDSGAVGSAACAQDSEKDQLSSS